MLANLFKKKLLSTDDENRIVEAIKQAELNTSGEIRVHIEKKLDGNPTDYAQQIFEKLNMHKTKERNGILFFVALNSKQLAVWGDEGIHQKVTQQFWDDIFKICKTHFEKNLISDGLEAGIKLCGEQLKHYFPYQSDDTNELPNQISY